MACLGESDANHGGSNSPDEKNKPIPRRNLSQAFEALCTTTGEEGTERTAEEDDDVAPLPAIKAVPTPLISPTAVTELTDACASNNDATTTSTTTKACTPSASNTTATTTLAVAMVTPDPPPLTTAPLTGAAATATTPARTYDFDLHPDLQRELSQALVNRVSFYGIIHDINKEATCMAANDPAKESVGGSATSSSGGGSDLTKEEDSPLVLAATGETMTRSEPQVTTAMIDDEQWLLDTIANRTTEDRADTVGATAVCPPTFSQAMGEKEYENPVHALSGGNRTQLWKPSRSWWEAKSGKNPWIEPSSHNKRWRYLWPLIHYHKFLAKCIKKLKRNGVDVKHSVSPVAVFLREEVCAVSDHLKDISLFGSDEWIACLQHFNGWTDPKSEEQLRVLIGTLKLRPLQEPGDVDSPLLRSQIDEHYLRVMEAERSRLRDGNLVVPMPTSAMSRTTSEDGSAPEPPKSSRSKGQPPVYPRSNSTPGAHPPHTGMRRQRYGPHSHSYPPHHYWGWEQQQQQHPPPMAYTDSMSVHSSLSTESGFAGPPPPPPYAEYPPMHYPYYSPAYGSDSSHYSYDHRAESYQHPHAHHHHGGWMDPAMAYAMAAGGNPYYSATPMGHSSHPPPVAEESHKSPSDDDERKEVTSPEYDPQQQQQSPFWSHLDRCVAMGLATPAKSSPSTPRRREGDDSNHTADDHDASSSHDQSEEKDCVGFASNAQPLLLRGGYYGYGHYGAHDGYAPPSPATQFLMSPQASFAYNYGYGFSPGRSGRTPRKKLSLTKTSPASNPTTEELTPPPPVRKVVATTSARESPSTVETTTESESMTEQDVTASS